MRVAHWPSAGRIERKALHAEVSHSLQSTSRYFKRHQRLSSMAFFRSLRAPAKPARCRE